MASNNNNRKFQGAEDLEGIDLRNLDIYDIKNKNYLGSECLTSSSAQDHSYPTYETRSHDC